MEFSVELIKLPSVFLVGPMGAGKTTIGKLLARQLGREFVDVDWYIEETTGADIPWIFQKEGEEGFRNRETSAIDELTQQNNLVLATGGGAVMREENRKLLADRGLVVYLNADVKVQMQRTRKDSKRPLLQNDNPQQVLATLYQVRDPLYREIADIELISGRYYPKRMVQEVINAIRNLGYFISTVSD